MPHHSEEVLKPGLAGLEDRGFLWKYVPVLDLILEVWNGGKESFLTSGVGALL